MNGKLASANMSVKNMEELLHILYVASVPLSLRKEPISSNMEYSVAYQIEATSG